jgi:hypothetical protein
MTKEDVARIAREAGFVTLSINEELWVPYLQRFANLVAAHERERVAKWMVERSFATWHGDTIEDLLEELYWQIVEKNS